MNKGFSLIQLLIAVAIIGVLSSVVLSAIDTNKDCSDYGGRRLVDIPARCVNYWNNK